MSESDASVESIANGLGAADDTVSKVSALIKRFRGIVTWPAESAKDAEDLMAAALLATTSSQADLGNILSLSEGLPVAIVECLFEKHWLKFEEERKTQLVSEMLKLRSEKGQIRQAAIAEKIARSDPRSAAYILHGLISSGKKGKDGDFWPRLSKEKKDSLRKRFGNTEWVQFDELEERVRRVLLAGFVEAMTEPNGGKGEKGQRLMFDFARWALSSVTQINMDGADRQRIETRVWETTTDFPEEWKTELRKLCSELPPEMTGQGSSQSVVDHQASANLGKGQLEVGVNWMTAYQITAEASDSTTNELVPGDGKPACTLEESLHFAVTALVKRKQTEVNTRKSIIALLQNDVPYVESEVKLLGQVLEAFENSELVKDKLESELKQITLKANRLQAESSRLELELASAVKAQQTAQELSHFLANERKEVQQALDEERSCRAKEQRELLDEIDTNAARGLEGFKAQLARSLRPVFKNKRNTDDQEPNARLSEFLRSWLSQIETQLKQSGVDISKDG